jgi:hypothetical protein
MRGTAEVNMLDGVLCYLLWACGARYAWTTRGDALFMSYASPFFDRKNPVMEI